jgi:hypothetical protein
MGRVEGLRGTEVMVGDEVGYGHIVPAYADDLAAIGFHGGHSVSVSARS